MEIIVNDTNIFIDLHSIDLLESLCELPYDIRTVDFVIAEIIDPQQYVAISALVKKDKIRIESFNAEELNEIVSEHYTISGNISIPDCSVCYYARKHSATLITGDRRLRNYAEATNVPVRGILFLIDELIANSIITPRQAAVKLQELLGINIRLPKSEIEKRINKWTKAD